MLVSKDLILKAKGIDLYDFLTTYHQESVVLEGNSCLLVSNHHVSVKRNTRIFTDFKTGKHGDSIDYLMNYLGYDFKGAVLALVNKDIKSVSIPIPDDKNKTFIIPPAKEDNDKVIAYLLSRGIEMDLLENLIISEHLYSDRHNNAIFINPERTFYELRGTTSVKFHRNSDASLDNRNFFYFNAPYQRPEIAYICESAIDALSLYQLKRESALYCSISGIANQQRIERIKELPLKDVILAFDADEPADQARERNKDLKSIIPTKGKDWNEQLLLSKGGTK